MGETTDGIVRIAKGMGFDDVAVDIGTGRNLYLKITNSEIDSVVEKLNISCNIFLTKDKRILLLSDISDTSRQGIRRIIGSASKALASVKPKEDYFGLASPRGGRPKYVYPYDRSIEDCGSAEMADKAIAAVNSALDNGATSVAGMVVVGSGSDTVSTSNGFNGTDRGTFARMSLRVFRGKLSYQNVFASRMLKDVKFDREPKEMAEILGSTKKIGKIKDGKYDIVYMQSPGGSLLTNAASAACMGNAETGSCFTGKLGKVVAGKDIMLYDDGRIREGIQSSAYDLEGTPSQRTKVVESGILRTYLHNHSTAEKYNTKSTGNAGLVRPSTRTLVMEHRKTVKDVDKLISSVDRGILVTNTWYTRFSSYIKGDFSTMPRDLTLYIEKGEPAFAIKQKDIGPIVGIRISDNLIRMLKNTVLAARNARQCTSWDVDMDYYFVPSFTVKDVTVTTVQ
ncbi:MAG: TldD/PmbA family protein [Candidatus Micrarchaeota archaeon]|nr:TldD/PmbA family protein [Candidatus Micrarchaeota archaeon]